MMNKNKLEIDTVRIEMIFDNLDTNVLIFHTKDSFLTIQRCVFLEKSHELNQPFIEYGNQDNSYIGEINEILVGNFSITFIFNQSELFLEKFSVIQINLNNKIEKGLIDFIANYLFLGNDIVYEKEVPMSLRIKQTSWPEEPL